MALAFATVIPGILGTLHTPSTRLLDVHAASTEIRT
jgi:hypothetical protein